MPKDNRVSGKNEEANNSTRQLEKICRQGGFLGGKGACHGRKGSPGGKGAGWGARVAKAGKGPFLRISLTCCSVVCF